MSSWTIPFLFLFSSMLFGSIREKREKIDMSGNYTHPFLYGGPFSTFEEAKCALEMFPYSLDEYFCEITCEVPVYGTRVPFILFIISQHLENSRLRKWLLDKTKKSSSYLVFAALNEPEMINRLCLEKKFGELFNKPGEDVPLTPGLALAKHIDSFFRRGEGLPEGGGIYDYVSLLTRVMPNRESAHKMIANYSLRQEEDDDDSRRLHFFLHKSK